MWEHLTGGLDGGQSHIWPTPRANEPGRTTVGYGRGLAELVEGKTQVLKVQWPTPRLSDTEGGLVKNVEMENGSFSRKNKDGVRWGVKLKDVVNHMEGTWPTPTTEDSICNGGPSRMKRNSIPLNAIVKDPEQPKMNLNADWVEWLMGYPTGWTNLETSPE